MSANFDSTALSEAVDDLTAVTAEATPSENATYELSSDGTFKVKKEATGTDKKDGIEAGTCSLCNQTVYREYAANVVTDDNEQTAGNKASDSQSKKGLSESTAVFTIIVVVIIAIIIITVVIMVQNNKRKRRHNSQRRRR